MKYLINRDKLINSLFLKFIPQVEIEYLPGDPLSDSIITLLDLPRTEVSRLKGDYLVMGLDEYEILKSHNKIAKVILIHEVKDVIKLCKESVINPLDTKVICNLSTHIEELRRSGLSVEFLNTKVRTDLKFPKYVTHKDLVTRIGVTGNEPLSELMMLDYITRYLPDYEPNDFNYANEWGTEFQLADSLQIPIITLIKTRL